MRVDRGEIDVYVEYTGTALLAILKEKPLTDPQEVYRRVQGGIAKALQTELDRAARLQQHVRHLVRGEDARKLNLKTVSDAAKVRPNGAPASARTSCRATTVIRDLPEPMGFIQETREMDLSLTYRALAEKQVDLIAGNSTDGLIARYGLIPARGRPALFPALRRRAGGAPGGVGKISGAARGAKTTRWHSYRRRNAKA